MQVQTGHNTSLSRISRRYRNCLKVSTRDSHTKYAIGIGERWRNRSIKVVGRRGFWLIITVFHLTMSVNESWLSSGYSWHVTLLSGADHNSVAPWIWRNCFTSIIRYLLNVLYESSNFPSSDKCPPKTYCPQMNNINTNQVIWHSIERMFESQFFVWTAEISISYVKNSENLFQ